MAGRSRFTSVQEGPTKVKICPICMGYLLVHSQLENYLKCPTCAFTVHKDSTVEQARELIKRHSPKWSQ